MNSLHFAINMQHASYSIVVKIASDGCFFFSSRRRHTRCLSDWSSDVCSSDLTRRAVPLKNSSGRSAVYTRVYTAERPELFFKGTARRVAGPEKPIVVRADSSWDVPEPEQIGRASCRERVDECGCAHRLTEERD